MRSVRSLFSVILGILLLVATTGCPNSPLKLSNPDEPATAPAK